MMEHPLTTIRVSTSRIGGLPFAGSAPRSPEVHETFVG